MEENHNDFYKYSPCNLPLKQKLGICAVAVILYVVILITLFPVQDIECSKYRDTCSIYSRNVLFGKSRLVNIFKISDIERYEIKKGRYKDVITGRYGHRHRHIAYSIVIYLKTGEKIELKQRAKSYERAQAIYNAMLDYEYIFLKGNYWATLFDQY